MVSLSATPDVRGVWRDAARTLVAGIGWVLWAVGWVAYRVLRLIGTCVAAVFFAIGFVGGRVVWPALVWSGRAVRLGWQEGRKPVGVRDAEVA